MSVAQLTESVVEDAALAWLESLGWTVEHLPAPQSEATWQAGGLDIAPGQLTSERSDYGQVVLAQRLRLKPGLVRA